MLSGGRMGAHLAGLGAAAALAGVAARAWAWPRTSAALLAMAGLLLAGAAWMILTPASERRVVRAGGWAVVVGFVLLAAYGFAALVGAPDAGGVFVAAFVLVVAGETIAASAFVRERGSATEAAWLAASVAGALVAWAAPAGDALVAAALALFFGAWAGVGFAVVRPYRTL